MAHGYWKKWEELTFGAAEKLVQEKPFAKLKSAEEVVAAREESIPMKIDTAYSGNRT